MKRILFSFILVCFAAIPSFAQYCIPTYTAGSCGSSTNTGVADYIDGVVTTGGTVNINNTGTACCGLPNNYIYYSALGHTGVQNTVVGYTLYNTPYWSEYQYIWVDWNQDGDFLDPGEDVRNPTTATPSGGNVSGTFTIPLTATPGTTRMRVRNIYATVGGNPCNTYTFGECEDYNFTVVAAIPCSGIPTAGTANSTSPSVCPTATFTLNLVGSTLASGISYQWQYSAAGANTWFNLTNGIISNAQFTNATVAGATALSCTITGQVAATDYRCIVTCANSGSTSPSTTVAVASSSFLNCYCNSTSTSTLYQDITNFTISNVNNNSSCNTVAPGLNSNAGMYSNFISSVPAINVTQTYSYPLSLTISSCYTLTNVNITKIYIDYNHNGTLTDPGEEVYVSPTTYLGGHTETGSITIPAAALTGNTLMRVVNTSTSNFAAVTPCGTYTYGETEDYVLNISAPIPCTGAPTPAVIAGPASACTGAAFTLSSTGASTAFGVTHQWQSAPNCTTGPWTNITGATNTTLVVAAGITTATCYRLVSTCSYSNLSSNSNTVSVTLTPPTSCFCVPTYAVGGGGDIIANVAIGTWNNNTTTSGNPSPYYVNYVPQQPTPIAIPNVAASTTFNLAISFGSDVNQYSGAWVDWNHDGLFATTEYFTTGTNAGAFGTVTIPIPVPTTALPGNTRLRIRGGDDQPMTSAQACGPSNSMFGEAEDYFINIVPPPPVPTVTGNSNICQGSSLILTASSTVTGATFTWSGPNGFTATTASITIPNFQPVNAGAYTVTVTVAALSNSNTVTVACLPVPSNTITASGSLTFCQGNFISLSVPNLTGASYSWIQNGSPIIGYNSNILNVAASGTYNVEITGPNGCVTSSVISTVVVNPLPNAVLTPTGPTSVCKPLSVPMSVSTGSGYAYVWKKNGVNIAGATAATYNATQTATYSVVVTDVNGCVSNSNNSVVNIDTTLTGITLSGPTSFCTGFVTMQAPTNPNYTYQWINNGVVVTGQTTSSYTVGNAILSAVTVSNVYVKVTNTLSGCVDSSATTVVTVGVAPPASISQPDTVNACFGIPYTLNANAGPGLTYQWYLNNTLIPGATTANYIPSVTGSYTVRVYSSPSCYGLSNSVYFIINPLPNATISTASGGFAICQNDTLTMNANLGSGYTYQWKMNGAAIAGASTTTFKTGSAGNYSVIVTSIYGCPKESNPVTVVVNPLPTATVTPTAAQNLCTGTSGTLFANTGSNLSYQWKLNNTNISGQTSSSITSNLGGNYTVEVTNTITGCKNMSTPPVAFILKPIPVAVATPLTGTSFCQGNSTVISATSTYGNTYQWYMNGNLIAGATAATYSATQAGSYTVVIQRDGCTNTSNAVSTTVLPYINPVAVAVGNTQICNGDSVTLYTQAGTNYSYQWLRNGTNIAGATSSVYKAALPGTYSVAVSYNGLCSQTSNGIAVNVAPPINTTLASPYTGPIVRFCPNTINKLEVQVQAPNVTYQWYYNGYTLPGAIGPSLTITQAGSYYVRITNNIGCSANSIIANVSYFVPANPVITQSGLTLGTSTYTTYQWYLNGVAIPGATSQFISINEDGDYQVEVKDANGCFVKSVPFKTPALGVPNVYGTVFINVYPNPFNEEIKIEASKNVQVSIVDITGKVVIPITTEKTIATSQLAAGLYFMKIYNEDGSLIETRKLNK
jgi:large repetitive protein